MTLAQLTAAAPRLALVGLAKNTGKTVTMNALLGELAAGGEPVGVTSVGRDGEQHDVIDFRIDKPLVKLSAGDLVATTDGLLSASGVGVAGTGTTQLTLSGSLADVNADLATVSFLGDVSDTVDVVANDGRGSSDDHTIAVSAKTTQQYIQDAVTQAIATARAGSGT